MDEARGEDRAGLAPSPAVEEAGDRSQDHVAPVGKVIVGDVREAEENGGCPPTQEIALARARKQILQQSSEEKLFGPGGKKQNAYGKNGKRFQRTPPYNPRRTPRALKLDEMHAQSQRNGDAGENDETRQDEEAPMVAPADGIAGSVDAAKKHECCECDVDAQQHGENVGEAAAREGPEPMRE